MTRSSVRLGTAALAILSSGALLAACASSDDGGSGGGDSLKTEAGAVGIVGDQSSGGDPVDGGTLSFGAYSAPDSLDPAVSPGPAGSAGGTEMASIYDLLVRYDAESEDYVPQLAESLEESDDRLTWTLTLRDGVKFSDGTDMKADEVIASIERFNNNHGPNFQVFTEAVDRMEAAGDLTVEFHMNNPYSEFPALLSFGHGMIVAPSVDDGDQFQPIGAGPFTVKSYSPDQDLIVEANEDYFNGRPHLDEISFTTILGDSQRLEALDAGNVDMIFLRDVAVLEEAKSQYPGFYESLGLGDVGQINNREGRPGADERVREALTLAIDVDALDQRARGGDGMPGTEIFPEWSKWHNDVPPLEQDVEKASELVEQAKADGFDGTINYVAVQSPVSQDIALAAQAQWEAVGFDVEVEFVSGVADMIRRMYVEHDFDVTYGSYSISDAVPFMRLNSALNSTSSNNILGYDSEEMDDLLKKVQESKTDTDERDALAQVQELVNTDFPFMVWAAGANFTPWQDKVHGAKPSNDAIILLDEAWIEN